MPHRDLGMILDREKERETPHKVRGNLIHDSDERISR